MTKSAQLLGLFFALIFGVGGVIVFIAAKNSKVEEARAVEGIISKVDCPRKYRASIMLKSDIAKYSLTKQFKDKTMCLDKHIANSLIGKSVKMRVAEDNQVFALTLNSRTIFTIEDLKQEKLKSSKVLLLLSLFMGGLVVYKRKTA